MWEKMYGSHGSGHSFSYIHFSFSLQGQKAGTFGNKDNKQSSTVRTLWYRIILALVSH
jgi:hypothetical protein